MSPAEEGWNAALASLCALARASAAELQDKVTEKPTRYPYAIEALIAIAEAGDAMRYPVASTEGGPR